MRAFLLGAWRWMLYGLALWVPLQAQGQTFTQNAAGPIFDTTRTCHSVAVTGLPGQMGPGFGLAEISVNLTHTRVSDLRLFLVSPEGTKVLLANRHGGLGRNWVGTCLRADAPARLADGTAPFTGNYRPDSLWYGPLAGQDPNGLWQLCFDDLAPMDYGILNSFSLRFSTELPVLQESFPCRPGQATACACPNGSDTCDLLPNLIPARLPLTGYLEENGLLRVPASFANLGAGPLVLEADSAACLCGGQPAPCNQPCPTGLYRMAAQRTYQRVGASLGSRLRPTSYRMRQDSSTGLYRIDSLATLTLRRPTADPNPRRWPVVAQAEAVPFCLLGLAACDSATGNCIPGGGAAEDLSDLPNAGLGPETGCGLQQALRPGFSRTFAYTEPGRMLPLVGLCNGTYALVYELDPLHRLAEQADSDNVVAIPLQLTQQSPPEPLPVDSRLVGQQLLAGVALPPGLRFVWDFGDGSRDSTANPVVHTYSQGGSYTLRLILLYPCGDQIIEIPLAVTGLIRLAARPRLKIFPNPAAGGSFTVRLEGGHPQGTLQVLDLAGHPVQHLDFVDGSAQVQGLASGTYLVGMQGSWQRVAVP